MRTSEATATIPRPAHTVFATINDHTSVAAWMEYHPALTVTSDGAKGVGTTLRYEFTQGGRVNTMEGAVTAFEADRRLTMRFDDPAFAVTVEFLLTTRPNGTELRHAIGIEPKRFLGRLMAPLIRAGNDRQVRRNLERLSLLLTSAA